MFGIFKKKPEPVKQVKKAEFSSDPLDLTDDTLIANARADYINNNVIQRTAPTLKKADGTAMDSCSVQGAAYQASYANVNPHLLSYFIASSSFIGYHACAVIAQHWLVAKGCSIHADDAVKKGWDISINDDTDLTPEQIKHIDKLDKKYALKDNMKEGVTFNNVFGVRHILFKHKNPNFDYSKPFNPDAFKNGQYEGIAQIDPYWITPEFDNNDLSDPTSINYYNPTFWNVSGKRYHRSHFVILRGDEVADYLKPTYRYGGVSLAQKIYERVYASERTANEAPQLAMTKRMNVRKTDLAQAQANKAEFVKKLQAAREFADNYGVQVIGKEEEISQLETSLADLDDVIMTQYQLVCSIIGAPATKILGVSPKGFSTGESDSDNYLEDVEELQGNDMNEIAQAHYARLIPSELGDYLSVKDLEIELAWRPLKIMSELERSTTNLNKAQSDALLYDKGAIDNIDIRQRIVNDPDSNHSGMSMPEEILEEDDEMVDDIDPSHSLNGAQVTAMTGIIEKVAAGEMSKETAVKVISASFPMSQSQAKELVSGAGDNI